MSPEVVTCTYEAPSRYPTVVRNVREVALHGLAEPGPWGPLLAAADLEPVQVDGQLEVVIFACGTRFKGKRYQEVSLSVPVAHPVGPGLTGGRFLVAAVNSVRFFAWVERVFFGAPYEHGQVEVDPTAPASLRVRRRAVDLLHASMGAAPREGAPGEDRWEGPLHLPPRPKDRGRAGLYFFGKLTGASTVYPFDPAADRFDLTPRDSDDPFALLAASCFRPTQWHVRTGALHARTRSARRR